MASYSLECPGCRGDKISTVPRVLPEKQCGTERVLPERPARPISQACTRIAWQPEVPVLGLASPSNNAKKMSCSAGPPARQLASFSRAKML